MSICHFLRFGGGGDFVHGAGEDRRENSKCVYI